MYSCTFFEYILFCNCVVLKHVADLELLTAPSIGMLELLCRYDNASMKEASKKIVVISNQKKALETLTFLRRR